MARPVATWRSAIYSTSGTSPYTGTTAWTPAANSLIVAFVSSCATSPSDPSSVSAHGVALTKVAAGLALSGTELLSVWVGDAGASPTNAAASATVGGTPTGCVVDEFEVTNWNTGLGSALAAVSLNNTGTGSGTSGTVAVRLEAQTVDESAWLSFYVHLANETTTGQGGNWTATAGGTGNYNSPATGACAQDNDTGYTATATASWAGNVSYAALVLRVAGTTEVSPSEAIKVADTVTAVMGLAVAVAPETLHLLANGQVDLYGLGAYVKVQDTVTASLDIGGLTTGSLQESLKVADTVTVFINPEVAAPSTEGLKLTDTATVFVNPEVAAPALENLKLADTATVFINPELTAVPDELLHVVDQAPIAAMDSLSRAVGDESLKVQDTVTVDLPLQPGLLLEGLRVDDQSPFIQERLKVSDTVTAAFAVGADLSRDVGDENLKVADTVAVSENPLLTSTPSESLKVQDAVTVSENPLVAAPAVESVKVQDSVVVFENPLFAAPAVEPVIVQDAVSVFENPLQTSTPAESLKVQDQGPTAVKGALAAFVTPDEILHVQDTVSVELSDRYVTVLSELLHLDDTGLSAAFGIDEIIHCVDQTPIVTRTGGGNLDRAVSDENVKVSDAVTALESPLSAAPAAESLKVQDAVSGSENPLFAAPAVDSLRVQDQTPPSVSLGGLSTAISPDEVLKLADSVSASLTVLLLAVGDENLKVQDQTPQRSLTGPGEVNIPAEVLKLADSTTTLLNPEFASPALEPLKLADAVQAAIEVSATPAGESLKLADTVTAALGLSTASTSETLKISDTVSASLTVLPVVVASETVKVSESVSLGVDLLSVVVTPENMEIRDIWFVEGTRRVIVRVKSRR